MDLIHKETPVFRRGKSPLDELLSIMILKEDLIELLVHLLEFDKQGILLVSFSLHGSMRVFKGILLFLQHTGGEPNCDFNIFVGSDLMFAFGKLNIIV